MRIYIAAPLAAVHSAEDLAGELTARGHIVVSGWHAFDTEDSDPLDEERRARILASNLADLDRAQGLIAITCFSDFVGRGTYGEIAWALARGLPVAWIQDGKTGRSIFDAHSLVRRFQSAQLVPSPAVVLADWARTHHTTAIHPDATKGGG